MAAQSTTCSSCQSAFSSYVQHSPFAALPTNLAFDRPHLESVEANDNISVAPTKSLNDGSSFTSISSGLVPRNRKSSPTNKGAYAAAFDTGASFTSLPTELMILIFLFACNDVKYWLTALALSVVSREWRSIAHALPELWTHIAVNVRRARPVEVVWWYLHLSRGAPLHVMTDVIGNEEFEQSANLLVQHATRWRRADIHWSQDLHMFKGIEKMGVPLLESLKFAVATNGWGGMKRCKAFEDAPRLREYSPWGVSPTECVVPWDRLKTVVLRDVCSADLTQYLRDAEELVLEEEYLSGTAFGAGTSIPLSAKRLTMRSVLRHRRSVFLEALVLPYLTTVDISIADWSAVDSRLIPSFIGMLKRSGCALRELRLHNVPLDDEALLNVLACTPDLQALTVHEPAREPWMGPWMEPWIEHCITNAFLHALSLPELRRLELVWSYDACEECVMDMVERMKGLESVVLGRRFGLELSERTVERMNVLRVRGVSVSQW